MKKRARIRFNPETQKWDVTFSDGAVYSYLRLKFAHTVATDWEKRCGQ